MGRFDSGGRHFGGFWENLPKNVRLRVRIEDGTLLVSTIHNSTRVLLMLSRRASHRLFEVQRNDAPTTACLVRINSNSMRLR